MADIEVSEGAREAALKAAHAAMYARQWGEFSQLVVTDAVLTAYLQYLKQHPEEAAQLFESLGWPGMEKASIIGHEWEIITGNGQYSDDDELYRRSGTNMESGDDK